MSTNVTVNNTVYSIPNATGETGWGTSLTSWIQAVSNSTLQKSGGTFTLTADTDFGATYGLKSVYYKSRGTVADSGILRLANAETIAWRNAADSANKLLTVNSSDQLTFAGTVITSSAGVVPVAAGGTNTTSYTTGDLIYASSSSVLSKLGIGSTSQALIVSGGLPAWGTLPPIGGGTGLTSYTQGDILYCSASNVLSKLAAGTNGQFLKTQGAGANPTWDSVAQTFAVASKSGNYTVTTSDNLILCDDSGGSFTLTLYAAAGNSGKQVLVKKTVSSANTVTIDANASETIDGALTLVLYSQYDEVALVCDGSNWHVLNNRIRVSALYTNVSGTFNDTALNTVTYGTKVTDTHSGMSGSTYTVPLTGFYNISTAFQVNFNATQSTGGSPSNDYMHLYKNGALLYSSSIAEDGDGDNIYNTHSIVINSVSLAAGDTLVVKSQRANSSGTASNVATASWFSIVKI